MFFKYLNDYFIFYMRMIILIELIYLLSIFFILINKSFECFNLFNISSWMKIKIVVKNKNIYIMIFFWRIYYDILDKWVHIFLILFNREWKRNVKNNML